MIIGIPKEIKTDEYRVSVTPSGVKALANFGAQKVIDELPAMKSALNTYNGKLTNKAVGDAFDIEVTL